MTTILFLFLVALGLSLLTTRGARWAGERWGAMDVPNARKMHQRPMARTGGLGVFAAFLLTVGAMHLCTRDLCLLLWQDERFAAFLGAAGLAFAVGLVDDFRRLSHRTKFLVQVLAASLAFVGNIRIPVPAFASIPDLMFWNPLVSYGITVFWFLLFMNAVNLIDGLDGLAGGVVLFASATALVVSIIQNNPLSAVLFAALSGSTAGFLRYNFPPATVFWVTAGAIFSDSPWAQSLS